MALVGCSSPEEDAPFPIQEMPSVAPTTTTVPYEVPETIDSAYVQRVVERLEEVRAAVLRDNLASRQFTDRDRERFEAIFADPALDFQMHLWRRDAHLPIPNVKENPDPAKYSIDRIVSSSADCIWVKSTIDGKHNRTDDAPATQVLDLVLKRYPHDESINPTPWVLSQFAPESLNIVDAERACG